MSTQDNKMIDEKILIGQMEVKNRIVMPPMQTDKTEDGTVTNEMLEYYSERAKRAIPGLIIIEHSYVMKEGQASKVQLSLADDSMIDSHKRLAEVIHKEGVKVFPQLNHGGSNGINERVSASDVNIPLNKDKELPRSITKEEILEIEDRFAEAAVRAIKAGYDGVEIHGAHAYLLNQFYSPITNRREDEYGGPLENRMRFLCETVKKVRDAIGNKYPIAVRFGGSDYMDGGNTEEDAVEGAKILESFGVDLIDVSGGMCFYMKPGHKEPGWFHTMTEKIKNTVNVPVVLTGGIRTAEDAERLLQTGKADMIGIGRTILKNPGWRE